MLYINGPYFVNEDLTLRVNYGSWNRLYGMLFIEQPLGVGFSKTGGCNYKLCLIYGVAFIVGKQGASGSGPGIGCSCVPADSLCFCECRQG